MVDRVKVKVFETPYARPDWERIPWLVEGSVRDYVPEELLLDDAADVWLEGQKVERDRWAARKVCPGEHIVIAPRMGDPATLTFVATLALKLAIAAAVSYGVSQLMRQLYPTPEPVGGVPQQRFAGSTPFSTTTGRGNPIVRVLGRHPVAAQILYSGTAHGSKSLGRFSKGVIGSFRSYTIFGLCRGPIQAIDTFTVPTRFASLPGSPNPNATVYSGSGIKINGNALKDFAGTGDVHANLGRVFQDAMPRLESVIREQPIGIDLIRNKATTSTTTQKVTGLDIVIFWANGLWYNSQVQRSAGQRKPVSIGFRVRARASGTTAWTYDKQHDLGPQLRYNAVGASIQVDFSRAAGEPWDQVTEVELTWDGYSLGSNFWSNANADTQWLSNRERNSVTHQAPQWPGIASCGIEAFIAESAGPLDNATFLIDGNVVPVDDPDNPDNPPIVQWTQNPAPLLAHELRDPLAGGYAEECIDRTAFLDWQAWCDEAKLWDPISGSFIARCQANGPIYGRQNFEETMVQIAAAGHANLVREGCTWIPVIDEPQEPIQVFNIFGHGNMTGFSRKPIAKADRPNAVKVRFRNELENYDDAAVTWYDHDRIATEGKVRFGDDLRNEFITHPTRAYAMAKSQGLDFGYMDWQAEIGAFLDAVKARPGETIGVHHHAPDWGGISGRVIESEAARIKLDQDLTVTAGAAMEIGVLTVGTGSPVFQRRVVTDTPATYGRRTWINTSPSWDGGDLPAQGDVFVAGADAGEGLGPARLYRIARIRRGDDRSVVLECVNEDVRRHNHYYIENFNTERQVAPTRTPKTIPPLPKNLGAQSEVGSPAAYTVSTGFTIVASWDNAEWPYEHKNAVYVQVLSLSTDWLKIDEVIGESYTFRDVVVGWDYNIAISPMAAEGGHHRSPTICPQFRIRAKRRGHYAAEVPA